jgi:hypothetical protein
LIKKHKYHFLTVIAILVALILTGCSKSESKKGIADFETEIQSLSVAYYIDSYGEFIEDMWSLRGDQEIKDYAREVAIRVRYILNTNNELFTYNVTIDDNGNPTLSTEPVFSAGARITRMFKMEQAVFFQVDKTLYRGETMKGPFEPVLEKIAFMNLVKIDDKDTSVMPQVVHVNSIANGALYLWGENQYGQLGIGRITKELVTTPMRILENAERYYMPEEWTYHYKGAAITYDRDLYVWGEVPQEVIEKRYVEFESDAFPLLPEFKVANVDSINYTVDGMNVLTFNDDAEMIVLNEVILSIISEHPDKGTVGKSVDLTRLFETKVGADKKFLVGEAAKSYSSTLGKMGIEPENMLSGGSGSHTIELNGQYSLLTASYILLGSGADYDQGYLDITRDNGERVFNYYQNSRHTIQEVTINVQGVQKLTFTTRTTPGEALLYNIKLYEKGESDGYIYQYMPEDEPKWESIFDPAMISLDVEYFDETTAGNETYFGSIRLITGEFRNHTHKTWTGVDILFNKVDGSNKVTNLVRFSYDKSVSPGEIIPLEIKVEDFDAKQLKLISIEPRIE